MHLSFFLTFLIVVDCCTNRYKLAQELSKTGMTTVLIGHLYVHFLIFCTIYIRTISSYISLPYLFKVDNECALAQYFFKTCFNKNQYRA